MLTIDRRETLEDQKWTVYRDDVEATTFYIMPDQPRFRLDDDGKPFFQFIKYRDANGQGGGLCIFDVECAPRPEEMSRIRDQLAERHKQELAGRPVNLVLPQYLDGNTEMLLEQDDKLIERIVNKGKPTLVGRNITSLYMQLSAQGAQVFEAALRRDEPGSLVQVVYTLTVPARMGAITARVSYEAESIATFMETLETQTGEGGGLTKTINRAFEQERIGKIEIQCDSPNVPDEARNHVRRWATEMLAQQMNEKLLGLADGISAEERQKFEEAAQKDAATSRKLVSVGWFWHWYVEQPVARRNQLSAKASQLVNFEATYQEKSAFAWRLSPQGMLPSIPSMSDSAGTKLAWDDYSVEVTTDSEFFRRLRGAISVCADFDSLALHNVVVHVEYGRNGDGDRPAFSDSFAFKSPDAVFRFETYYRGEETFTYHYEVNFRNTARTYTSDRKAGRGSVSINPHELGILAIDPQDGGLDFNDDLKGGDLTVRYRDPERGVDYERTFVLDENALANIASLRVREPIFGPPQPYSYRVRYFLRDGILDLGWQKQSNPYLLLSPPFRYTRRCWVIGEGFDDQVDRIDLELQYENAGRGYTRSADITLDAQNSDHRWRVPALAPDGGSFYYSGLIRYKAGSSRRRRSMPRTLVTEQPLVIGDDSDTDERA